MAKLLFQVQEKTLKTIHQTFEGIKEAFLGVKNGEFLPTAKLIAKENYAGQIILRSLVADGMFESRIEKGIGRGGRPRGFRPTQGGWELLAQVEKIPAIDLYKRYMDQDRAHKGALAYRVEAPTRAKQEPKRGRCTMCRGVVVARNAQAKICWGCEKPARRRRAGMDHWPRSEAYLRSRGATAGAKERARVEEIIAMQRRDHRNGAAPQAKDGQIPLPADKGVPVSGVVRLLHGIERRLTALDSKVDRLLPEQPKVPHSNGTGDKAKLFALLDKMLDDRG